jgi:GNAT superfamily N-acetyltransferase
MLVERLPDAPTDCLRDWLAESEEAGSRIVRRLIEEWASGVNRFDRPGEALLGASLGGRVVGVCGLNRDPYAAEAGVGRVRHLYVHSAFRRLGVGRHLVAAVIAAARDHFDTLRLRTANPAAARLYEALGFRASNDVAHCTHVMRLAAARTDRANAGQRRGR